MIDTSITSEGRRSQAETAKSADRLAAPSAERPRVLLVGTFLSGEGRGRSVSEDLAQQLTRQRWSVTTTSTKLGRLPRLCDMVSTIWRKRQDYDVAHVEVYSGWAFVWAEAACWALRRAGKPYAVTLHGGNLPTFAQRHPRRVRTLLGTASTVLAPSRYLQQTMQPYRSDIRLLPNPLDLAAYRFEQRQELHPRLIWLRAFSEIYNPTLAPEVLARLADEFPQAELTMVGPDKGDGSFQRTQQVAHRLGVADRLHLPGVVSKDEVANWLQKGDVFLNTTNFDNTPVSVLEALACGLCVVSTDVGGLPYLLTNEMDSLLVPPKNADAMANAVRRLLREPALAARLSLHARRHAEQFDWSHLLPQWSTLLTSLHVSQRPLRNPR